MMRRNNLQVVVFLLIGFVLLFNNVYAQEQCSISDALKIYIDQNYDEGEPPHKSVDENGISWAYATKKGLIVQAVSIEGRDGMVYESTTRQANDAFCNINLPECIIGNLVIEVDVRANEAESKKEVLKIGNEDNAGGTAVNYLLTFASEGIINVMGSQAGTYEVNKWYHIMACLNLKGTNSDQPSTAKVIIQDEAGNIIIETANEDYNVKELKSIRIASRKPEEGIDSSSFYIDNLKLYELPNIIVTDVVLDITELFIETGDTRQLTASINPEDASNNAVTWTTTDDNIANVDDQGLVTAISPGTAIIRATSVDNPNAFAECTVNVVAAAEVNKIEIYGPEKITIPYSGNKDEFYYAVVKDQNGDTMLDEVVTWSIEPDLEGVTVDIDTGVVTVESSVSAESIILKAVSCSNSEVFSIKTINLKRDTPVVTKIKILGLDSIILQRDGNTPQEVKYTVIVEDQNGNAMPNETVLWSIQPKKTGISINDQGVVTVNDDAKAGSYEIKAVSVSNPNVSGTLTLVLVSPEAPYWPDGSQLNYKNLSHTSATLTWNAAEDNKGIVGYAVYRVDDSLLTVCDCVYSYLVSESVYFSDISSLTPGTAYTFKVEAVDTDGNWTADGPSATFTTKTDEKPNWQAGKKLEALNIAASSLKLTWSDDAKDDRGIKNYVIYKNGEELKTVAANIRTLDVTGLTPGTEYTFKVEAVDTAGQYSDDGPTVQCTTKENFSISTSFRVGSTDDAKVLEANQMLDAAVTVTNYQQTSQQAMLIVALYNNSGAMVNVSYVSRNIAAGDTEYLHAGFKLPSEVEGYTVKAFVWEGTDIASSNMQPISRVEMIPQQ